MKLKFAPTLIAGAFALAAAGCMTERTPGSANESAGPMGQSNYCATHATEARCAGGRDAMGFATDPYGRTDRDVMGDRYSRAQTRTRAADISRFPRWTMSLRARSGCQCGAASTTISPDARPTVGKNSNYSRGTTSR